MKITLPNSTCQIDTVKLTSKLWTRHIRTRVQYRCEEEVKKCWILLLTCLNCRAHHIIDNAFLHSLRRFVATNGCPKRIICDNAPAFTSFAQAQSDEPSGYDAIRESAKLPVATNKIQFKSITPSAIARRRLRTNGCIFKAAFKQAIETDTAHGTKAEAICNTNTEAAHVRENIVLSATQHLAIRKQEHRHRKTRRYDCSPYASWISHSRSRNDGKCQNNDNSESRGMLHYDFCSRRMLLLHFRSKGHNSMLLQTGPNHC
ncbi:hypothetical protein COOONC_28007 [Cooperia oncophora]